MGADAYSEAVGHEKWRQHQQKLREKAARRAGEATWVKSAPSGTSTTINQRSATRAAARTLRHRSAGPTVGMDSRESVEQERSGGTDGAPAIVEISNSNSGSQIEEGQKLTWVQSLNAWVSDDKQVRKNILIYSVLYFYPLIFC